MASPAPDDHHAAMHADFRWHVPERFNIAQACCRRWTEGPRAAERVAIIEHLGDARTGFHSYVALQEQANRLSSALAGLGVRRGDRVALILPQRFETAVACMAALQMGAIAVPLSQRLGPEALAYRLRDASACTAICDGGAMAGLRQARAVCPELRAVIGLGDAGVGPVDHDWQALLASAAAQFEPADTRADDPALLLYASDTPDPPRGVLIPQRALIGKLPGFVCSQNGFGFELARLGLARVCDYGPEEADATTQAIFWSSADWAGTGGLLDALLPTLFFGRPIVACSDRFDPELAFEIMARHRVTHSFLPPTALEAMMKAVPHPRERHVLRLQALASAGALASEAVFAYCQGELDVVVNETFGPIQVNGIIGNCSMNVAPALRTDVSALPPEGAQPALGRPGGGLDLDRSVVGWPARPNSMGRPYPGHRIALLDEAGRECPPGTPGEVAVHRRDVHGDADPVFFLGYWSDEEATRAGFTGDWWRTGDVAQADEDGYLWRPSALAPQVARKA
jgi:acetyl-CoA synthetase